MIELTDDAAEYGEEKTGEMQSGNESAATIGATRLTTLIFAALVSFDFKTYAYSSVTNTNY